MAVHSSNKTHIGDTQVRDSFIEAACAEARSSEGPNSPGDGSSQWSLSPASDPYKKTRFVEFGDSPETPD